MKHTPTIIFLCLFLSFDAHSSEESQNSCVYGPQEKKITRLINSVDSIIELIQSNNLGILFESPDLDVVTTIMRNYSPVHIALELDVLGQEEPVILFFNSSDEEANEKIRAQLKAIIHDIEHAITIVEIDTDQLFSAAHMFSIKTGPCVLAVHNNMQLGRKEDEDLDVDLLGWIEEILEEAYLIKK